MFSEAVPCSEPRECNLLHIFKTSYNKTISFFHR